MPVVTAITRRRCLSTRSPRDGPYEATISDVNKSVIVTKASQALMSSKPREIKVKDTATHHENLVLRIPVPNWKASSQKKRTRLHLWKVPR